jgi:hypothetical protein
MIEPDIHFNFAPRKLEGGKSITPCAPFERAGHRGNIVVGSYPSQPPYGRPVVAVLRNASKFSPAELDEIMTNLVALCHMNQQENFK